MKHFVVIAGLCLTGLFKSIDISGQSNINNPKTFHPGRGTISLGARNTYNVFFESGDMVGQGAGGSFRIQLGERVNTEWFADYVSSNLYDQAERVDKHIGWNVMYYLIDTKDFTRKFTPFLAAGHCFDYTGIRMNGENNPTLGKWTSAVQMSLGTHYNINPRFDFTLSSLYDLHLGHEIDVEKTSDHHIELTEYKNGGWEAHVMIIMSVNYKIWSPTRKS